MPAIDVSLGQVAATLALVKAIAALHGLSLALKDNNPGLAVVLTR